MLTTRAVVGIADPCGLVEPSSAQQHATFEEACAMPGIDNFAAVPLFAGPEIIGLVGLANRAGGFDDDVVGELEPLLLTLAAVMASDRSRRAVVDEWESSLSRAVG